MTDGKSQKIDNYGKKYMLLAAMGIVALIATFIVVTYYLAFILRP